MHIHAQTQENNKILKNIVKIYPHICNACCTNDSRWMRAHMNSHRLYHMTIEKCIKILKTKHYLNKKQNCLYEWIKFNVNKTKSGIWSAQVEFMRVLHRCASIEIYFRGIPRVYKAWNRCVMLCLCLYICWYVCLSESFNSSVVYARGWTWCLLVTAPHCLLSSMLGL